MRKCKMFAMVSSILMVSAMMIGCGKADTGSTVQTEKETSVAESSEAGTVSETQKESSVETGIQKPDNYPTKTISWIVPAAAGAAVDIPTRILIDSLDLGGNIIVENIAGASNVTGILEASGRPGDGYTILTANSSGMVSQPSIYDTGYKPEDFRHIALLEPVSPFAVVVNPKSEIETVDDWINFVKSGQEFNYSVPNAGASSHLAIIKCLEELGSTSGTYVPYNGTAEVSAAVQSGEIDFAVLGVSDNIIPQAAEGNMRIIVVLNDEVCNMAPEIPIISDYGVKGCNVFYGFKYVAIKKDTPDEIVDWLKQEINAALESDKYKAYIEQAGLVSLDLMSEEELTEMVNEAYETYSVMMKELGMTK